MNVKYSTMRDNKVCRPLDFRRSQTVVGSNHCDKQSVSTATYKAPVSVVNGNKKRELRISDWTKYR